MYDDPTRISKDELEALHSRVVALAKNKSDDPVTHAELADVLEFLANCIPDFFTK